MAINNSKSLYNQYEELLNKFDKQEKLLKETNKVIKSLNKTITSLNKTIDDLKNENEELKNEILRLKTNNNKDSSNSSKPSSTNGYKKVITNRREKSNKKQGGQLNHTPHSLNNKLDQFINSGDILETIIEVNKNEQNKNKRFIEKVVIDVKIIKTLTRYRYYPDKNGKYNIPKIHNQNVQYGSNVVTISIDLMNHLCNSTDGVVKFISDITNKGITLSKGTLCLWQSNTAKKFKPEIDEIEMKLLSAYYINHDESQIKINGEGQNIICACDKKHTRLWRSKHKSQDALKEIDFLPKYYGIIVKDGTELYNGFGIILSQCNSHIMRYLKGIYENNKHKGPKEVSDFLSKCNDIRNEKIKEKIESFTTEEYNVLINEYDQILDKWEKELREDTDNYLFNDELKLWTRLKYDNKNMDTKIMGDRDEVLYFLKDFQIPFTNNQAESAQRFAKIKQKIGKWRSNDGAEDYLKIRSCIDTYKKNNVNVFDAIKAAVEGNPIIV